MAPVKQRIKNCLWFDNQAEEAAQFYTSIFPNSSITGLSRYGKEGFEFHKQKEGTALVVTFSLDGQNFMALNGGPVFQFNEAISLVIECETQEEIDHYWYKLIADGGQESNCGWLKDKYGVSWQVVPSILGELMGGPDKEKAGRVTNAFMQMKKFDIARLKEAASGN